jgi:AcrR family transcriptional regulator
VSSSTSGIVRIVATQVGRRERKKRRTRELIAETAKRMFIENGFDAVTVVAIAEEADVHESTVFNHFRTKEDLALEGLETFESDRLAAVANRPPGESIVETFTRLALEGERSMLENDDDAFRRLAASHRLIANNPTLLAREREIRARYVAPLAALIAEETRAEPEDLEPWVVAQALLATHQAIVDFVRRKLSVEDIDQASLAHTIQTRTANVYALLRDGIGSYGVKRADPAGDG